MTDRHLEYYAISKHSNGVLKKKDGKKERRGVRNQSRIQRGGRRGGSRRGGSEDIKHRERRRRRGVKNQSRRRRGGGKEPKQKTK